VRGLAQPRARDRSAGAIALARAGVDGVADEGAVALADLADDRGWCQRWQHPLRRGQRRSVNPADLPPAHHPLYGGFAPAIQAKEYFPDDFRRNLRRLKGRWAVPRRRSMDDGGDGEMTRRPVSDGGADAAGAAAGG